MRDPKQGTSSSYLIELRKLTTQKREDHSENDRMGERRRNARLSGSEKTARTWGNSQEETWAERQEECGCDDQVGLRQNETHRLRNQRIGQEKHKTMEEYGHAIGTNLTNRKLYTICP